MAEDFPALAGFRAGSLVAGYRLEAQVGAGGMAVVFRAHDERLGRRVALKILTPGLASDPEFRRRFIAESRAAALVDDPYIIPVYEAGEADGVLFIAMRFVVGGDLRLVLDREGALPPGRAAGFISPVASALDAAHHAGLVHRDVKPANILVDARKDRPDHVYLSDFGVSKGALSSAGLTGTGRYLGTPEYSAPEQIQGLAVDGRTDQYALACVAYQLLTGAVPFERDQGLAVLLAHLSAPPPALASRRPGLPGAADQVLARGLAKAPEKRYGSCGDFADALREALGLAAYHSGGPVSAPGHPHPQTQTQPGFPGPAVAWTGQATAPADPAAAATLDSVPGDAGSDPGPGHDRARPARRPRRRFVVIALACAALVVAGVIPLVLASSPGAPRSPGHSPAAATSSPATFTDPGNYSVSSVAFSPDGKTLAADDSNGSTYLWNAATKSLAATLTDPSTQGKDSLAFSPDGTTLAICDGSGSIYLWNVATKSLAATLTARGPASVASVAFSPNGTTLAAGGSFGDIYLWNVATKSLAATLTDPDGYTVNSVAFSPDSTTLAAGDNNGSSYLWNAAAKRVAATLTDPYGGAVDSVAFSPDGTTLAAGDNGGNIYLWNAAAKRLATILSDPSGQSTNSVAFSPDGTTLAVGDGNSSTYLWHTPTRNLGDSKVAATLTDPSGQGVNSVAFSPNGTTLAVGDVKGSIRIWRISLYVSSATTEPDGRMCINYGHSGNWVLARSGHIMLRSRRPGGLASSVRSTADVDR